MWLEVIRNRIRAALAVSAAPHPRVPCRRVTVCVRSQCRPSQARAMPGQEALPTRTDRHCCCSSTPWDEGALAIVPALARSNPCAVEADRPKGRRYGASVGPIGAVYERRECRSCQSTSHLRPSLWHGGERCSRRPHHAEQRSQVCGGRLRIPDMASSSVPQHDGQAS